MTYCILPGIIIYLTCISFMSEVVVSNIIISLDILLLFKDILYSCYYLLQLLLILFVILMGYVIGTSRGVADVALVN